MAERRPPGRIGKGLLGLQAQRVARHHPADPLDQAGFDQPRGGDHRQERLAAARGDGGEDVAGIGPAGGNSLDHARKLSLMGPERARVQGGYRKRRTMSRIMNIAASIVQPEWVRIGYAFE